MSGCENIADTLNLKINYEDVNEKINEFRKKSQEWLLNSLTYKNEVEENRIKISDKRNCVGCFV